MAIDAPGNAAATAVHQPITVDAWPHPLTAERRAVICWSPAPGEDATLARPIADAWRAADGTPLPLSDLVVDVDGRAVARDAWATTRLRGGEIVTLRGALRGGGDSDPLRTVLTIAVIVAAVALPFAGALAGTAFAAGTLGGALLSAGIMIGGTLIVNALAPPRLPGGPGGASEAPEPVYSLAGGANRARLYEPLPLVLGTHRMFPDLGAREYTTFDGGEQYLHQIFHFGLGALHVSDIRIGDTPIGDYDEVETEWDTAGDGLALVAGNVDTVAGGALELVEGPAQWVARTSGAGATRLEVDLVARLFRADDRGDLKTARLDIELEWRAVGDVRWTRQTHKLSNDNQEPLRVTIGWNLPAGRYEVRLRCVTGPSDNPREAREVTWSALRAFQPDTAAYRGQTRLGVRVRATGQLSGRLDRLSALVSQRVPMWDGGRWTAPAATSNPAWIFRWYARGVEIDGRLVAGVGLAPERIDDAALKAWGAWCDERGLGCNAVIDRRMSHAEVLTMVAQCGRASPSWQSGRLGVVWDAADTPATALVSPGNIVAGSFAVEWAAGEPADEIVCRYIDPALDWQWNTVRRTMPGVAAPRRGVTLTLAGVTSPAQAAAECNLQAARQRYHRRRLIWEMGPEGIGIARGDVVHLTHGLIDGGTAGRAADDPGEPRDPAILALDRAVRPGATAAPDRVLLRLPDGAVHGAAATAAPPTPGAAVAEGETDRLRLDPPPPTFTGEAVDVLWRLYAADAPPARVRVVAVEPSADGRFRFEALDEVAEYHAAADSDLSVPLPPVRRAPGRAVAVHVSERAVRVGAGYATEVTVALTVAGDWRSGTVRARLDGGPVRTVAVLTGGATDARWIEAPSGELRITVVPGSAAAPAGAAVSVTHRLGGPAQTYSIPAAPTGFRAATRTGGVRVYRWDPHPRPDVVGYELRYGPPGTAWPAMTALGRTAGPPWESGDPPAGAWRFAVAARAADGSTGAPAFADAVMGAVVEGADGSDGAPGERGADGEDGIGEEQIFAVAYAGSAVGAAQRPANGWGYDRPGSAGSLQWHDAIPEIGDGTVWVSWRNTTTPAGWTSPRNIADFKPTHASVRALDGRQFPPYEFVYARTFAAARPPAAQWPDPQWPTVAKNNIREGLVWHAARPPAAATVWRCTRPVAGRPEAGAAVAAAWTAPAAVGRLAVDGADGTGKEYVFTRTAAPSVPPAARPSNDWGYDRPGTRGGLAWHDGAPALSESEPYLWRCERRVSGAPSGGDAVADAWSEPVIVGRYGPAGKTGATGPRGARGADGSDGSDGMPGVDGAGVEYIFARTSAASLPRGARPSNGWGYDSPGTRGGLAWHDGAPALSESEPYLWRCERRVSGAPSGGDAVADAWSEPVIVGRYGPAGKTGAPGATGPRGIDGGDGSDGRGYEYVFARTADTVPSLSQRPSNAWGYDRPGTRDGLTWYDAAPDLNSTLRTLWRCERRISGNPAVGDPVADAWSAPVSVARFGIDAGVGTGGGLYYVWDSNGVRFRKTAGGKLTDHVDYPSSRPTPRPYYPPRSSWR